MSGKPSLVAPFPYFGGKRDAATVVWEALGADVTNYVEPFFGSGAVLLQRPGGAGKVETVNDKDGLLCNVWRALRADPDAVALHADWPVSELDQHARHMWLLGQRERITDRLIADPEWFDAKAAGWWVWGASQWIGSGWCSGEGGWSLDEDGTLQRRKGEGASISRKKPNTTSMKNGIHRDGATRSLRRPVLHQGTGIHNPSVRLQMPGVSADGRGVTLGDKRGGLQAWFDALAARLRRVRVLCGDWQRVLGPSTTYKHIQLAAYNGNACGIFLDPPYSYEVRKAKIYAKDSATVAADVRAWCARNGENKKLRIALAGYEGEGHEELEPLGWRCLRYTSSGFFRGGYGNQGGKSQRARERLWLSPHCLQEQQGKLDFGGEP